MNKEQLKSYKWDKDLNKMGINTNCFKCSYCSNCRNCSYCRNLENKRYCICNVQLTKEEYEKKMKELVE